MSRCLTRQVWMSVAFCGAWSCPATPLGVDIVRRGRPTAVILVADNTNPAAFEAAAELARVVEKASGARLFTAGQGRHTESFPLGKGG